MVIIPNILCDDNDNTISCENMFKHSREQCLEKDICECLNTLVIAATMNTNNSENEKEFNNNENEENECEMEKTNSLENEMRQREKANSLEKGERRDQSNHCRGK